MKASNLVLFIALSTLLTACGSDSSSDNADNGAAVVVGQQQSTELDAAELEKLAKADAADAASIYSSSKSLAETLADNLSSFGDFSGAVGFYLFGKVGNDIVGVSSGLVWTF